MAGCRGQGEPGQGPGWGLQHRNLVRPALQLARIAAWLTPDTIPGLDTLDLMQAQQVRRWPGSLLPLVDVDALERLL